MTTTDEKSAGMPTTGRFGKLRTLAGRVLRRGPVGPEPVQRRAPLPMTPTGECTARWCMAHEHGPRPGLAASRAKPVAAIAHEPPAAVLAQASVASAHESGTAMEMPLGQGVRALLAKMETTTAEPDAEPATEPEPAQAVAEGVEATSGDGIAAAAHDGETTPNVATAPDGQGTPDDGTLTSGRDHAPDAAANEERTRDSGSPALIPEVLPPAVHNA